MNPKFTSKYDTEATYLKPS